MSDIPNDELPMNGDRAVGTEYL